MNTIDDKVNSKEKKGKPIALRVAVGVGLVGAGVVIGYLLKDCPECACPPESPAAAVAEDKEEEIEEPTVPSSPVEMEASAVSATTPADPFSGWYGLFMGTGTGKRLDLEDGQILYFSDTTVFLEINNYEECNQPQWDETIFCDGDLSWGLDIQYAWNIHQEPVAEVLLYLPRCLSEAANISLSDNEMLISPTEEHPYELMLIKEDDRVRGSIVVSGGILEEWDENARWIPRVMEFEVDPATYQDYISFSQ